LLTFTKAGQPVTAPVALGELLQDTARFALAGSNVDCVFDLAPDLWPCLADGRQIGQVIDNLLLNSRHAMPEGGTVRVAAENLVVAEGDVFGLAPGRHLKVVISDHGQGIPWEIQTRVFDPFFTTKAQRHRPGVGDELLDHQEARRPHRARVHARSRHDGELRPAGGRGRCAGRDLASIAEHQGRGRVLVMDDEAPIREIAREALQGLGYEVATARNGIETLALVERASAAGLPFDVAILDLTIPGHSGAARCSHDFALWRRAHRGRLERLRKRPRHGAATRLRLRRGPPKPFRLGELSDAVRAALASGRDGSPRVPVAGP